MEFTKCQGCQLLSSIPTAARETLHHFEVAAVLQPFTSRPPLPVNRTVPQRSFVYVVVTDWAVLLVSMPSSQQGPVILLEVPLLLIQFTESRAGVDAGDLVNDSRGDVRTSCISIYPKQRTQQQQQAGAQQGPLECQSHRPHQQQQQQQTDAGSRVVQALQEQLQQHLCAGTYLPQQQQAPWHHHDYSNSSSIHGPLQTVPERTSIHCVSSSSTNVSSHRFPALQQPYEAQAAAGVQVQHMYSLNSSQPAPWSSQQQHQQQQTSRHPQQQQLDESYCLQLMTVERCSRLWFHLQRAWVGAHMRAALAAAGAPGLCSWVPPSQNRAKQHCQQPLAAAAADTVHRRGTAEILILSGAADSTAATACGLQESSSTGCLCQLSTDAGACCHHQHAHTAGKGPFAVHLDPATLDVRSVQQQLRRASIGSCYEHRSCAADSSCVTCHSLRADAAAALTNSSSSSLQLHAQRRMGRPSTAGALAHSTNTSANHSPRTQHQHQQHQHNHQGGSSASSSSRSSSRPSTGESKQQLLLQQLQPAASGWSPWAGLARRWSLGNFPGRGPSRGLEFDAGSPPGSPPNSRGAWRPVSRGQQHVLREFMQAGAEVLVQPTAAVAREVFWELADALLAPCSLFDAGDTLLLHRSMMELASSNREQAAAMKAAFFGSSKVMEFIVARLTSWGSLMGLFPEGLPPIQNPAQPGCIEAWQGRPVVWATWLVYPGRPKGLLRGLGLTGHSSISFRSALQSAMLVAQHHRAAVKAWASSTAGGSSGSSVRQVALGQTYYADPLNLSPLSHMPYLFVADARRMLGDSSSEAGAEGPVRHLAGGSSSLSHERSDSPEDDLVARGTLAEVTVVLRWERLVGRLAAAAAERKALLLLQWLHLHLSFTEGCSSRGMWLSHKALTSGKPEADGVLPAALTFKAATQQLVAYLLTLHIPHVRACLAAAPQAAGTKKHHSSTISTSSQGMSSSGAARVPGAKSGPESMQDLLWWAEGRCSSRHGSSSCVMLDCAVGVLHELLGLATHEEQLLTGTGWAEGAVMEVLREVPQSCLQPLLRAMFLRFICLMTVSDSTSSSSGSSHNTNHGCACMAQAPLLAQAAHSSSMQAGAAAVLAFRYGTVLLELLGGVLGCAGHLHDAFSVEVQHLMAVPQVEEKLMAAAASCRCGVLSQLNQQLLCRVLAAVKTADPFIREQPQYRGAGIQQLRLVRGVMKVQN